MFVFTGNEINGIRKLLCHSGKFFFHSVSGIRNIVIFWQNGNSVSDALFEKSLVSGIWRFREWTIIVKKRFPKILLFPKMTHLRRKWFFPGKVQCLFFLIIGFFQCTIDFKADLYHKKHLIIDNLQLHSFNSNTIILAHFLILIFHFFIHSFVTYFVTCSWAKLDSIVMVTYLDVTFWQRKP